MSIEPTINFVYVSRLNDGQAEIRIETNSRTSLQDALVHLGLASAHAVQPVAEVVADVAQPAPEKAARKAKAKPAEEAKAAVAETVAEPVAETVAEPVAETVPEQVIEAAVEAAVEAAPEVAASVAAPAVTVEEAAAAVRAYGAKNGLQAARDLLQKFGFARTTEVTADKAGEIVAAAAL